MRNTIIRRTLTDSEIEIIVAEMKCFPDVGLYTRDQWKKFGRVFIIEDRNIFIGVCVVIPLKTWVKIGPIIISKSHQGRGFGKTLLTHIEQSFKDKNIYIGSSNKKVGHIMEDLHFQKINAFYKLPWEIQWYLIKHFFQRINGEFLSDAIPKIFHKSGNYRYFVKYVNTKLTSYQE